MATPCYWLEATGRGRVILRRFTYSSDEPCPSAPDGNGHDASVVTSIETKLPRRLDDYGWVQGVVPKSKVPDHRDKRWPKVCEACGEKFPRGADWQAAWAEGYVRTDTGETVWARHVMGEEFAGALFDAWWLHGAGSVVYDAKPGADGIVLVAVTPNGGQWIVDGKATSGGRWTRTGDPRKPETLSVTPSIMLAGYHGFLTDGVFSP